MILPAAQDRGIVVFYFWPSLGYERRLAASFALIAGGLVVQLAMAAVFPAIVLVAAGNLLLLVRGYDNRVDYAKFDPGADWERIDTGRLDDLRGLHRAIRRWDASSLDVTSAVGLVLFLMIAGASGVGIWLTQGMARILVVDAAVLLLPHWLTGVRSILVLPKLMIKVDMIRELLERHSGFLADQRVQLLALLQGDETRVPRDLKFKVDLEGQHEDFIGLYGQIVLNEVQGKSYPYFYVVLVSRQGFGLGRANDTYQAPAGLMTEFDKQGETEVLVLRQATTKTSGYHTEPSVASTILGEGLTLASKVAGPGSV